MAMFDLPKALDCQCGAVPTEVLFLLLGVLPGILHGFLQPILSVGEIENKSCD